MPRSTVPATERPEVRRRLASLDVAAKYVGTSPRTIRRAIAEGRLTGYRFGSRLLRVDLNELDATLEVILPLAEQRDCEGRETPPADDGRRIEPRREVQPRV